MPTRVTHPSWKSGCAPLGHSLDSPKTVASPKKPALLPRSACPARAPTFWWREHARTAANPTRMRDVERTLLPFPSLFPGKQPGWRWLRKPSLGRLRLPGLTSGGGSAEGRRESGVTAHHSRARKGVWAFCSTTSAKGLRRDAAESSPGQGETINQ